MTHEHELVSVFDLWNPALLLVLLFLGYVYFKSMNKITKNAIDSPFVSRKQKISLLIGFTLFYIGQGSPLSYFGHHYFFSLHMLQQTIIFLIVPIFIWMAIPESMLRQIIQQKWVKPWFHFFTKPLIALFTFNILISIYHFPFIMDGLMRNDWLHLIYHTILIITSFFMWFPIFGQLPEYNRLSDLQKIGYIFANGLLLTPACALIIFSDTLLYESYANVHTPIAWLNPLDDQQLGGVIMKIVQEIVYGFTLAHIFFNWYRKEKDRDEIEALQ